MNMPGFSSSAHFAHVSCCWKFFLLHYTQVLCQYRLCKADQDCVKVKVTLWLTVSQSVNLGVGSHWKTPKSSGAKKVRQSETKVEVRLVAFFDTEGIVRAKFVPRGTTANSEYYKGLLECLRNDMRRKRPENCKNGSVLHHNNAPCHTSLVFR
jgi:hypothetical protein